METWKPVLGFKGLYEVSDLGGIRRTARPRCDGAGFLKQRPLKPRIGLLGYLHVGLCKDGKVVQRKVHRLVLEAFVGPQPPNHYACHYPDPTPGNCALSNLMWGTWHTNFKHRAEQGTAGIAARNEQHGMAKLTQAEVNEIRRHRKQGASYLEIVKLLSGRISISQVGRIVQGINWRR